jgi:hypothetical protein
MAGTPSLVWVASIKEVASLPSIQRTIVWWLLVRVGAGPAIVTSGFGSLWVANYEGGSVWRLALRPPA